MQQSIDIAAAKRAENTQQAEQHGISVEPGDAPCSFLAQRWVMSPCDERMALALAQRLHVPDMVARLLVSRGVTPETAEAFLHPTLREAMPDPQHLRDMEKAAARLAQAIMAGEIIGIFGDYDVDGATSASVLFRFLQAVGAATPLVHIPDRQREGYGPNTPALLALQARGARVVVTVDCGTLAFAPLADAAAAQLDVVVIDHHIGEIEEPPACAIVNPNRFGEESTCRALAAVGVTFLVVIATLRALRAQGWFAHRPEPNPMQWLDLVALGTVCDVVPLTGLNRALVRQGLKVMAGRTNLGLTTLMDRAGLDEPPGTYHAGFILGPRINAGGRVGQADLGFRLLTTEQPGEAATLAEALERHNAERKTLEALMLEQALAEAERAVAAGAAWIVVASPQWHMGVIGIIAGRLKDRFHRPVAVIALDAQGVGKASARSVPGIDIGAAVLAAKAEGLLLAGGGHAMAAGFTVEAARIADVQAFWNARYTAAVDTHSAARAVSVDGVVSLSGLTPALAEALEQAGPFGQGNPAPRLLLPGVRIAKIDPMGEDHLRLILVEAGVGAAASRARVQAVAFRHANTALGENLLHAAGRAVDCIGQLKLSQWNGAPQLRFHLEDAAWAGQVSAHTV